MCRCLDPDERLFKIDDLAGIRQRVAEIEEFWEGDKRFPFGICGAMWYGTPVVSDVAHHRIKWRYGVEFEFEFHRVSEDGKTEVEDYPRLAAIIANDYIGRVTKWCRGGITEDHSLDRGWEVILPAMSIAKASNIIQLIVLDQHIRPYLRHGGNAAMHVTVDPFDTVEQQKAFHDFWDHPDFFDDFYGFTGRRETSYTRRRKWLKGWKGQDGFMKPDTLKRHYHRCNVRRNGAMEVRVFQVFYDDYVGVMVAQLTFVDQVNKLIRKGIYDYDEIKKQVKKKWGMKC